MSLIEIVRSDPTWPAQFQTVAGPLRAALGALALRIDHIGSTAVPGLAAKDIVDVQVTVAELDRDELVPRLQALGWQWLEHISDDHLPPGRDDEPAEWAKLIFREPPGTRRVNLHVRAAGRANQRYALLFRDFLRADPGCAGAYGQIKVALARLHPDDADAYYDVKDPVCDVIMAAAERWARETGYAPRPSDA